MENFRINVIIDFAKKPFELEVKGHYDMQAVINRQFIFEIIHDGTTIAVLIPAEDFWCQAEGSLSKEAVRRIGREIGKYYGLCDD